MTTTATAPVPASPDTGADLLTVPFAGIPHIPTRWLWPGIIPFRTPVLTVAPGGTGKGLSIAAKIAIVTNGWAWPNEPEGTRHEPRSVVLVAPEDDPNEDMRPRLEAAGADLDLVGNLTVLPDGAVFTLPEHLGKLAEAIMQTPTASLPPVAYVALDPLQAIVDKPSRITSQARQTWDELAAIARDYGVAMEVSHHTTKNGKVVAGSAQLTNAARVVYLIGRAKDDSRSRVISVFKANKIDDATTIRYRIEGSGETSRAVFAREDDTAAANPGSRAARLRLHEIPRLIQAAPLVPATPAQLLGASPVAMRIAAAGECTQCGAPAGCGCDRGVSAADTVQVSREPVAVLHVARMVDAAVSGAVPLDEITAQFRGALPTALQAMKEEAAS